MFNIDDSKQQQQQHQQQQQQQQQAPRSATCYMCKQVFDSPAAYRTHLNESHRCAHCGATVTRADLNECRNCLAALQHAAADAEASTAHAPRLAAVSGALEHVSVYETRSRFFLVGSTADRAAFHVLKIERARHSADAAEHLAITEDPVVYTRDEKDALLRMIDTGNKAQGGLTHVCDAFGLLGFVRFVHGHYLILITRRRPVGLIGRHRVYAIDETVHFYLPLAEDAKDIEHATEKRYKDLFFGVDVTKGFYFSYTYDLTHSLQHNMSPSNHPISDAQLPADWSLEPTSVEDDEAAAAKAAQAAASSAKPADASAPASDAAAAAADLKQRTAFRSPHLRASWQFVWNSFLMREIARRRLVRWILPVIHGHFDQRLLSEFGRTLQITLIARRSRMYAGVRFLKRGVNTAGYVGNDVETEQVVADISATSGAPAQPPMASFVQLRGSIPLFWSQENKMFEPKPAINLGRVDPFYTATVRHFVHLIRRYGMPVLVLNLIKQSEKLPRESKLNVALGDAMRAVNHSLPPLMQIPYVAWDWKAAGKRDLKGMIAYMCRIAESSLDLTGYFCSRPPKYRNEWLTLQRGDAPTSHERMTMPFSAYTCSSLPTKANAASTGGASSSSSSSSVSPLASVQAQQQQAQQQAQQRDDDSTVPPTLVRRAPPAGAAPQCYVQRGVLRTNCIDSLDRTNAAHFLVGRAALGRQLYALGVLADPVLGFTDSAVELLMEMYEIVGNRVALQYAGSEAVHTMKTYNNKGLNTSQARDLLTTVKRYISNSFTDSEKQNGINLFLGRFEPWRESHQIWELESDWLLHNREQFVEHRLLINEAWWRAPMVAFNESLGALRFAPTAPPTSPWRAPLVYVPPTAVVVHRSLRDSSDHDAAHAVAHRAPRAPVLHAVDDVLWHEWYAVNSLSSFDAILAREYNWPTRHYNEQSFENAGNSVALVRGRGSSQTTGGDGGESDRGGGALSTQLSGIKKFIPFGRRSKKRVVKRAKPSVWHDFQELPPLWRALLADSEHEPPPDRFHYSLAPFTVTLNERADSTALYRRSIAEAHIDARASNARAARRQALMYYCEHVRRTDGHVIDVKPPPASTVDEQHATSPRGASSTSGATRARSARVATVVAANKPRNAWSTVMNGNETARFEAYVLQFDTTRQSIGEINMQVRTRAKQQTTPTTQSAS
jgi:hypothetical protein